MVEFCQYIDFFDVLWGASFLKKLAGVGGFKIRNNLMFKILMSNKMRRTVKNTHEFIQYIHIIHIVFHCDSVKKHFV